MPTLALKSSWKQHKTVRFLYRSEGTRKELPTTQCRWNLRAQSKERHLICADKSINHNGYNSLKCDWCINCCILLLLIRNRTVGCNRTVTSANHFRSSSPNPPITTLITIIILTIQEPDFAKFWRFSRWPFWKELNSHFASYSPYF